MPHPGPLTSLSRRLRDALGTTRAPREVSWAPPGFPMRQALKEVRQAFGGDDDPQRPQRDDMVTAVRRFVGLRQVDSFTQLKYVCYGVTVPLDDEGKRLIDRTTLFRRLLDLVNAREAQAKQFRRCYQGLLAAYFGFDRHSRSGDDALENFSGLRSFLDGSLEAVATAARGRGRSPEWLDVLSDHRNLLTDTPCERYAKRLRKGDRSELEGVCAGLDIAPTSWVWHEAVMAYVREVTDADDRAFKAELPLVLAVIDGNEGGRQLPAPVSRDAVALTVARYERCSDKTEHPLLRDVCLRRIGNPWLEREAWDASVKSEPARKMVEAWLKRRLIKDFFELLAHDGAADPRRLKYWLKWEPRISDMWFVLGTDALYNRSANFVEVRQRMVGRSLALAGTSDSANNAFVMRIGQLLVIEFGKTGNACYIFEASKFRGDLSQRSLNIHQLKQKNYAAWLSHSGAWEPKFDASLRDLLRTSVQEPAAERRSPAPPPRPSVPSPSSRQADSASKLQESGTSTSSDAPRVVWPAFTPPKATAEPKDQARRSADEDPDLLKPNPKEIERKQLETLKASCQLHGVTFEEPKLGRTRTWVHLTKSSKAPDVAVLAVRLGFAFAPGKGYYVDQPKTGNDRTIGASTKTATTGPSIRTATPAKVSAAQVELLRRRCEMEGVSFEDNRSKGGAIWVRLTARPASAGLAGLLKGMGFRLAPGKGYYLDLDD